MIHNRRIFTFLIIVIFVICGASISVFAGGAMVIRGVVVDLDGNPLAGATVTMVEKGGEYPRSTTANKKGKFGLRIPDYDLVYDLTVEMEGYGTATAEIRPNPETKAPLTVTLAAIGQSPATEADSSAERDETDIRSSEPVQEISEERKAAIPIFNEGVTALEADDLPVALEKFKQALDFDPEFVEALHAVALVGAKLDENETAADAAEKLVELQPDNYEAIWIAYFSELKLRDMDRAVPAARRLVAARPEVATKELAQHARVLFDSHRFEGSRALLEIIVETAPDFAPAYLQLGMTCNALADTVCAVSALEKFLELAPDDPEAPIAQSLLDYLK